MSIDWYHVFLVAVLVLWAFSVQQDRNALRIVVIATLFSEFIVDLVTHNIHGAWKLVIPGAVETITIIALFLWANNRSGHWQAYLLTFAWLAHLLCYVDTVLKTDLVYSNYETILMYVAVGQVVGFHETISHIAGSAHVRLLALRDGGRRDVPSASGGNSLLPDKADQILPPRDGN